MVRHSREFGFVSGWHGQTRLPVEHPFENVGRLPDNEQVMAESSLWPYENPSTHETMSAIIQRRSTNRTDVRKVALGDLDLSFARSILDLGCGFGFLTEVLAERVAPDARFVGVDAWRSNETPFLQKVVAGGHSGSFICMQVDSKLPWPQRSFDLVVCSYSLYFFVDVLPEIARVLAPHGLFLTITHSDSRLAGQLPDAGFAEAASALLSLIRRFSAENGRDFLSRWFGDITRIDYANSLRFEAEHVDELLTYLRFKLPFLVPGSKPGDDLPESLARFARDLLARSGEVVVEKNDAAFRCRRPLCH